MFEWLKPTIKFRFLDQVNVIDGFYQGQTGLVLRRFPAGGYLIQISRGTVVVEVNVHEHYLTKIDPGQPR